ncbi:hypothetical protein ACH4TV_46720 [Streptomyces sp. NPDC020898]|uniref:hypothetical protein n=1 Tax=Streptomyces sp. NPDC020898 TaxID=3365101 RepID=UPI0037B187C6
MSAERWVEVVLPGVVRRVLAGGEPQPRWMPGRVLTVVSADVDTGAGVGAVWMVWRPRSARAREHFPLLERYEGQWRYVGGASSGPVDEPFEVNGIGGEVLEIRSAGGALSLLRRVDPPRSIETAPAIGCVVVQLGPDVGHILVGDRRIRVPERRRLIAAWMAPAVRRGVRPVIVALGRDGAEVSRIGPYDSLDSHTWGRVGEELDGA